MTESSTIPTIETARTDVALRKMGQFFATHITDVHPTTMGTAELRAQIDPDAVALHIRGPHAAVAAINSHVPISFAQGAATSLGDLEGAARLLMETRLLEHLAVAPRHRGRGYARALLAAAEQQHRATDGVEVWFGFVDDRERDALGLYRHLGFEIAASTAELPGAANIIRRARISRTGTWIYKTL